jgi:multicomponent Na+:H+ antiporter subunit D
MSVSSYALTAWFRTKFALEAAIKYLLMGALSTSLVLLGILLMYGLTGTLTLADIATRQPSGVAFSTALALIITGFSVKAAVIPFHFWKPDAAEGAVEPVAAIFCGLSAAIGFYGFTRLLFIFNLIQLSWILIALGVITMVGGALFALVQNNIKRLLAYSTISQFGYVFIALGLGPQGLPAALFHVLNNGLIKVLLFLTVGIVVYHAGTRHISELGGMGKTIPVTAFCFGIGALALTGVPGLNGFASKYLIYLASWEVSPALLVAELVVSGLTLAYYLRVFSCVFLGPERHGPKGAALRIPKLMVIPPVILALLCIVIGVFPQLAMYLVEPAAASLLSLPNYISVVLGG